MNIFFLVIQALQLKIWSKGLLIIKKPFFFGRKNKNFKNFTYFDLNNPIKTNFKKN